ncbi:hypothetical protein YDYSY3_47700 [Paenibacillus chitinolyticus]|uniref:hypothetical protein n=1 Tax=Paenibacillus chitinolyticus TaxID=79263 RepID=UPI0026E4DB62|nr:hypothetical protein [Paenibacillus chitinolyticus]GKS13770.1 hypothetical protein YDYSY3_47700 [Paenibacillus chitinolyticus]
MEWVREATEEIPSAEELEESSKIRIVKRQNMIEVGVKEDYFDAVTYFFLTPIILNKGRNKRLQLSISDNQFTEQVIAKFLIFFESVLITYEDETVSRLVFNNLKHEAEEKLSEKIYDNELDSISHDLFLKKMPAERAESRIRKYEVITDIYLQQCSQRQCIQDKSLWQFLMNTILAADGEINISPSGWELNSSLLESVALNYFVIFSKKVELYVDEETKSVAYLRVT